MQIRAIQIFKQSLLSGREMILSYGWNHPAQWEKTSSSWSWDPRNQKEAWEKKQRKKQSCFSACVVVKMRVSNLPRSSCWTLGTCAQQDGHWVYWSLWSGSVASPWVVFLVLFNGKDKELTMFICLSHWEKRNIRQVADCSKVPGFLATSFETWSKDITQTHVTDTLAHRWMAHAVVGRGMDGQMWFSSSVLQRARDFTLCAFLPLPPANLGNRLPSWPQGCPVSVSYPSLQQNTWDEERKGKKFILDHNFKALGHLAPSSWTCSKSENWVGNTGWRKVVPIMVTRKNILLLY